MASCIQTSHSKNDKGSSQPTIASGESDERAQQVAMNALEEWAHESSLRERLPERSSSTLSDLLRGSVSSISSSEDDLEGGRPMAEGSSAPKDHAEARLTDSSSLGDDVEFPRSRTNLPEERDRTMVEGSSAIRGHAAASLREDSSLRDDVEISRSRTGQFQEAVVSVPAAAPSAAAAPRSRRAPANGLTQEALESELSEVLEKSRRCEEDLMPLLTLFFKTQPHATNPKAFIYPERKARLVLSIRQAKLEGEVKWAKRVQEILGSFEGREGGRDQYWRDPSNSAFLLQQRLFIKEWFDPLTFPMRRLEQDVILRIRNEIGKLAAR